MRTTYRPVRAHIAFHLLLKLKDKAEFRNSNIPVIMSTMELFAQSCVCDSGSVVDVYMVPLNFMAGKRPQFSEALLPIAPSYLRRPFYFPSFSFLCTFLYSGSFPCRRLYAVQAGYGRVP